VAGLGGGQRRAHGLLVAHLADQDHVGVLAQHAAHGAAEADRVGADFALVDDRVLVGVQVLDRVLERDDVAGPSPVDVIDHRRQRRALAGAGGAGDEDDPALLFCQRADHVRQGPRSSTERISTGIARQTIEVVPRCLKVLTRKRERPGIS